MHNLIPFFTMDQLKTKTVNDIFNKIEVITVFANANGMVKGGTS